MPKMQNSGITMTVPDSMVQTRLAQGWAVVEDAPAEAPAEKPKRGKKAVEDAPAEAPKDGDDR